MARAMLLLLAALALRVNADPAQAPLHTYGQDLGFEVVTMINITASKLQPLLPAGYDLLPAQALPFFADAAGPQGVLGFGQFRGVNPTIDGQPYKGNTDDWVSVEAFILTTAPPKAAPNGLDIFMAFHSYLLNSYTNYTGFIDAQKDGGMPAEKVKGITYQRNMNATGFGTLLVKVPGNDPFKTKTLALDHPDPGYPLNVILWRESNKGTGVVRLTAFPQGQGFSAQTRFYAPPGSLWRDLTTGAGYRPCLPDLATGWPCVLAPALNQLYPAGLSGKLWLL